MSIIKALADELKEYSSLTVRHLVYDPMMSGESVRVKKVGYKHPMGIILLGDQLYCKVLVHYGDRICPERGGRINLAEPDSIEQLLAMLKRDLK